MADTPTMRSQFETLILCDAPEAAYAPIDAYVAGLKPAIRAIIQKADLASIPDEASKGDHYALTEDHLVEELAALFTRGNAMTRSETDEARVREVMRSHLGITVPEIMQKLRMGYVTALLHVRDIRREWRAGP